jgi:hypothetical protein
MAGSGFWGSSRKAAISNQQSAISNQQSAISNQQSAISNQQSVSSPSGKLPEIQKPGARLNASG